MAGRVSIRRQGVGFVASRYAAAVSDAANMELLLTASATVPSHVRIRGLATGDARLQVFEDPTVSNAGTANAAVDRNRNSPGTAATVVTHTPTTSADGTLLLTEVHGNTEPVEWTLEAGEQYLIRLTNVSGGAADLSLVVEIQEG